MNLNELKNCQSEFYLISNSLLKSNESTFKANVGTFRDFYTFNEILSNIIKDISSVDFGGIEYFNNKTDLSLRHSNFTEPKNHKEILKFSYDVISDTELRASHVYNYANRVLHPNTSKINELLLIGIEELFTPLINYINLELNKLIRQEEEKEKDKPISQVNYTINNASNSIIGNQENATINNSYSLDELKDLIDKNLSSCPDKEELNELINMLKVTTENNIPMQKGMFQKFGDTLIRHSWLMGPLGTQIVKWLSSN